MPETSRARIDFLQHVCSRSNSSLQWHVRHSIVDNANRAIGIVERAIRIILALLLIMVGMAHQPPSGVGNAATHGVAAYVLPDGTVPELCVTTEDGGIAHHGGVATCEACLIASATLLPVPVDLVGRRMLVALNMSAPVRNDAGYRRLFPPNTAPRAPPVPDSL